jgi:hypothetical protein
MDQFRCIRLDRHTDLANIETLAGWSQATESPLILTYHMSWTIRYTLDQRHHLNTDRMLHPVQFTRAEEVSRN